MNLGQLISGLILSIGGVVLLAVFFFSGFKGGSWVALIYGLPALILGIFILLYKKEDKIEQIKKVRVKGGKKK